MKKLLITLLSCILIITGCSKKEKITGTPEELSLKVIEMIENKDYSDLEKFEFADQLEQLGKSGRSGSILEPTLNTLGEFYGHETPFEEKVAQYLSIAVPCHFEQGDINIHFYYLDGKLANIIFNEYSEAPTE